MTLSDVADIADLLAAAEWVKVQEMVPADFRVFINHELEAHPEKYDA